MTDALSNRAELADLFPARFLDVASEGREEEFLQPLVDLGYLEGRICEPDLMDIALSKDRMKGPAARQLERAVRRGLRQFRKEAIAVGLLSGKELASDLGDGEDRGMHPGTKEMDLLHELVSLDGEGELEELPAAGDTGLRVRILQYQLDVYGCLKGEVGEPFQAENFQQLERIRTWLGQDRPEDLLPLLADAELLCTTLLDSLEFPLHSPMVAYFKTDYRGFLWDGDRPARFRKRLEKSISPLQYVEVQKQIGFRRRLLHRRLLDEAAVLAVERSEINRFVVRLVQVRQWMRGFYHGRLDSDFGPVTLHSLGEFADVHDVDLDELLVKAGHDEEGGDHWCLNFVELLRCMKNCDTGGQAETVNGLVGEFEDEMEELASAKKNRVLMGVGDSFKAYGRETKSNIREGRRVYYGSRSLVRSLSAGIKKVVDFFVRGAKRIAKIAQNLAKLLFRMLREGLRVLGRGLKFLFGKRTITTRQGEEVAALTNFDFDMDVHGIFRPGLGKEALALHRESLQRVVNGLMFSMELTGTVLNIVVNVLKGPVGWVKLAMTLARKLAELLLKRSKGGRRRALATG